MKLPRRKLRLLPRQIYIYALRRGNGEIFYFGQSVHPQTRLKEHKRTALFHRHHDPSQHTLVSQIIAKAVLRNEKISLDVLVSTVNPDYACKMERYLIKHYEGQLANGTACPMPKQIDPVTF